MVRAGLSPGQSGASGGVHKGDADGRIGEGVGEVRDFRIGFVGHFDPRALERLRVEVAGLDFVELQRVDLGETAHQAEQGERVEAGVFATRPRRSRRSGSPV